MFPWKSVSTKERQTADFDDYPCTKSKLNENTVYVLSNFMTEKKLIKKETKLLSSVS